MPVTSHKSSAVLFRLKIIQFMCNKEKHKIITLEKLEKDIVFDIFQKQNKTNYYVIIKIVADFFSAYQLIDQSTNHCSANLK